VHVLVGHERAEEARGLMLELFPEGFEEVERADGIELAAYTNSGGEERLWQAFGPGGAAPVEAGWAQAWKRFHRPVRIGPVWVGPPWCEPDPDALAVVVDPGQAFGTGGHSTTRLCLELLVGLEPTSLVDLGCGSGVLGIAAARLGFSPVTAIDLDPLAVEAARANAAANGVEIDVRHADMREAALPAGDVAVANVTLEAVEALAQRVHSPRLVASGYLASERPAPRGWTACDRREEGGWAADLLERSERLPLSL